MENVNIETKTAKTQIFNVVILDQSGSMSSLREAAVSGLNETIAGIRKAQENYADSQEHFFTLVAFCGCEKRKIYDKVPVREIGPLSAKDYRPCCTTPLYDAMGFTLNDIRHHVDGGEVAGGRLAQAGLDVHLHGREPRRRRGCLHPLHPQRPQLRLQRRRHRGMHGQGHQHPHEPLQTYP